VQGHGAGGAVDPVAAAPAGVVAAAPKNATPSAAAPSKTPKSPRARATRTPKALQTRAPHHQTSSTPRPSPSSVTVNGAVTDTMYGPVQVQVTVQVTVQGARIVSAHAIDYPQGGGRDQEINSRAIPALDQETVQAQSARIDTVSGATYTSDGYRRSLQSALDAAHRAA
jgi:uncharacterized protein with FMN-binding domain